MAAMSDQAQGQPGEPRGEGAAARSDDARRTVTCILNELQAGRGQAADELLPLVYDQLRAIAQQRMNEERAGHTLQATALVHEAYLRLVGDESVTWESRAHFYVAAAEGMRRILIDHARRRVEARIRNPRDADFSIVARDIFYKPIDAIPRVTTFVELIGAVFMWPMWPHVDKLALGHPSATYVLIDKYVSCLRQ